MARSRTLERWPGPNLGYWEIRRERRGRKKYLVLLFECAGHPLQEVFAYEEAWATRQWDLRRLHDIADHQPEAPHLLTRPPLGAEVCILPARPGASQNELRQAAFSAGLRGRVVSYCIHMNGYMEDGECQRRGDFSAVAVSVPGRKDDRFYPDQLQVVST